MNIYIYIYVDELKKTTRLDKAKIENMLTDESRSSPHRQHADELRKMQQTNTKVSDETINDEYIQRGSL